MDLDAYRRTADRFITELMREYYRHYAGLKDSFEIDAIYAAHEGLFTRDAVQALRDLDARSTEDGDERRRARMLLDFAVEGYVGAATKAVEEELAGAEAALTIELGDERIGFREGPVVQANEADPGRRAEIEPALLTATDEGLGSHSRERDELPAHARARAAPDARDRLRRAAPRRPAPLLSGVAPIGGWDDYVTLFHEGGHTEHSANVDPELPFEFRRLGDNSISETYAFLLQHLVEDPEWLSRRLGVEDPSGLVAHAKAQRLVYLRRYAGVGARGPSAPVPARAVRAGVVRVARGRGRPAEAVARRPAPRRGRAARGADRRAPALRCRARRPRAEQQLGLSAAHGRADPHQVDVELNQDPRRGTPGVSGQCEQDVLGADALGAQHGRLPPGAVDRFTGRTGERQLVYRILDP
jgi:hypothetical protein